MDLAVHEHMLDNYDFTLHFSTVLLIKLFEFWCFAELLHNHANPIQILHLIKQISSLINSQMVIILYVLVVEGTARVRGRQRWHELEKGLDARSGMLLYF